MNTIVVQARLPKGLVKEMDAKVKKGDYSSRSDVIKTAVRKLSWSDLIGIIPNTGDSVKEVREIRKKLSKEIKTKEDFLKLNKLLDSQV